MKTPSLRLHAGVSARLIPSLVTAFAVGVPPLSAAPPTASPPAPKPYTMFLGVNMDVQQGKELCRVQGVRGDRLIARVDGELKSIPTNEGPIGLRVRQALKLRPAADTANLAGLKVVRAYTSRNDPRRKFFRQQPGSSGMQPYDIAQMQATEAHMALSVASGPHSYVKAAYAAAAQAADQKASEALGHINDSVNLLSSYTMMMNEELARQLFDAIQISFKISSPVLLDNPYIVVIAQYHNPDSSTKGVHNWIFAQQLDPIGPRPHDVSILRGGFPKGYKLEKYQVHIFNNGKEVATTVSKNRMGLTWDQAFDFRMIDYISSHKDMNVPARPAMAHLPPDLRAHLNGDALHQMYYVKVGKDGVPLEAYLDASCRKQIENPYLQGVIRDIRFNPQLDKGKPVPGVALLKLSELH